MQELINRLNNLLVSGENYISNTTATDLESKSSPEKWSKKEILGHLIDSGVNNLQRFNEIQFEDLPYKIRKYGQNDLVKSNDYQNAEIEEILQFWLSINNRISSVIKNLPEEMLSYSIIVPSGETKNVHFLIEDYVDHLEHHLKQIIS